MKDIINILTPELRDTTSNYLNLYKRNLDSFEDMEKIASIEDTVIALQTAPRLTAKLRNAIISYLTDLGVQLEIISMGNQRFRSDLMVVNNLITYYRGI